METFMKFVILLAITAAFALVGAWFTEQFVNYLFASTLLSFVFGVAKIGFWQGFIINLLFGSFRSGSKD